MPTPTGRVVLDPDDLAAAIARLGGEIEADFPDGVVLVGVMKGALLFLADLARALQTVDVRIDFLAISRYAPDTGRVRIVQDVSLELAGSDVVLVEDIVDTGLTVAYLRGHLEAAGARRVELCTLLDRPGRRIVPVAARYVGATVDERFLLGYGLHHLDRYRNLPAVIEVERDDLSGDLAGAFAALRGQVGNRGAGGTLPSESEASA